ncbi:hypothetical protein [Lactiplantibacillus daowaiensis]|uniref:Surface layer protein A domain-containing protein n=1 Tax=Lactiplantibacillus daowaiensis TaxID=2559918 RepID=A0ABW1RWU0_9LACO|nr:hypothetical protein [Lactiplantibacillus daowaiensis]
MKLRGNLVGLGVLVGLGLLAMNANAATKYIKIGKTNHNFVQTQRTLKIGKRHSTDQVFTIPKGTIVEVKSDNKPDDHSGRQYVSLDMERLSYHLRGVHNNYQTKRILASTTNFKKVRVPQYVQYYTTQKMYPNNADRNRVADGNLYLGLRIPDKLDYTKPNWTERVYVTADGYLEYYAKAKMLNTTGKQVPTVSAKITKVKRVPSSGLTQLYTKQAIPSAVSERVSKTGEQQYVTTIKRRYKSSATINYATSNPHDVSSIDMAAQYQIKDRDFFMVTDYVGTSN